MDDALQPVPDAELIERCLRKDNAAWDAIVVRYQRKVFHIAYKFNPDPDFSTWLSSVARNYCIDHYRASKREREVLVEDLVAFDLAPASAGSSPHRQLEDR